MIKEAITQHEVINLIKNRWSPRAFSDKPVSLKSIETIIEAASWAPSAMNEQPWKYHYAFKNTPGFETMVQCLSGGNQSWAKNAAVLLISVGIRFSEKNGQPIYNYLHDVGLANANLITQAFFLKIYAHMMAGFDKNKTIEVFGLNETEEPVCFIALGYLGDPNQLAEPFKSRELAPRVRKSLDQISLDSSFLFQSRGF